MITITQSQNIDCLYAYLQRQIDAHPWDVFEEQLILVPSHGVGEWLKQRIAQHTGIAAQVKTSFMGTFQWQLYSSMFDESKVPTTPLSASLMQWPLFALLKQHFVQWQSAPDLNHVLSPLMQTIAGNTHPAAVNEKSGPWQQKIWHIAGQIAQVFAAYVVYRQDWLSLWQQHKLVDMVSPLRQKQTPNWQIDRCEHIQAWQAHLWQALFAEANQQRLQYKSAFWQALAEQRIKPGMLPRAVFVFGITQLPPAELEFLQHLATFTSVHILHYNPSQEFWADVVDAKWLARQTLKNPAAAAKYDSQHPLLTRFGKQARDVFRLLVNLSGQEDNSEWTDAFISTQPRHILAALQSDILHLHNVAPHSWQLKADDTSIAFHACHSTLRQLEVLLDTLIEWFAADLSRQPSDVVVFMPDVAKTAPLVRAVFSQPMAKQTHPAIPFSITGVADSATCKLWQGLTGFYTLLTQRFTMVELLDWLSLPPMMRALGLTLDSLARIEDLLGTAGFKRGFDAIHIAATLASNDTDYRFTFRFALDRLTLAMAMPVDALHAGILPLTHLNSADFELIALLENIYSALFTRRIQLQTDEEKPVTYWLQALSTELHTLFADDASSDAMQAVQRSLNGLADQLLADKQEQVVLPLTVVLDEITAQLDAMPPSSTLGGRVTFARLGTLRPLAFKLVVILDLNQGEFPAREEPLHFDLMSILPSRLGDRSRKEYDLGAFLEALLLAQDACWLFYNGFDNHNPMPRQPATPVIELMAVLETQLATASTVSASLKQLCHEHSLEPFDPINFSVTDSTEVKNTAGKSIAVKGREGIWFEVVKAANMPQQTPLSFGKHIAKTQPANADEPIIMSRFVQHMLAPARFLLDQAAVKNVYVPEQLGAFEPLTLGGLARYQLLEKQLTAIIALRPLTEAFVPDLLPVGAAKHAYFGTTQSHAQQLIQLISLYGGTLHATTLQTLTLFNRTWQSHVPTAITPVWLSIAPNKASAKHKVRFWLEHLWWQIYRGSNSKHVSTGDGKRIGIFADAVLTLPPILAVEASTLLFCWFEAWQKAALTPWVLPPDLAMGMVKKTSTPEGDYTLTITDSEMNRWLNGAFVGSNPRHDVNCAKHPDWQLVLHGRDAKTALMHTAELYALPLYAPIKQHMEEKTL